jgi:DNA uptake protein ComE-like DNA-binding protein
MKKAIGAFVTGLMLSGAVAALYQLYRRRTNEPVQEADQEQTGRARAAAAPRPRRERRPHRRDGLLDLNGCSLRDLAALEGLDRETAGRVIENRPYRNKLDLVSRMVVPEATYVLFSHFVTVSDPNEPVKVA